MSKLHYEIVEQESKFALYVNGDLVYVYTRKDSAQRRLKKLIAAFESCVETELFSCEVSENELSQNQDFLSFINVEKEIHLLRIDDEFCGLPELVGWKGEVKALCAGTTRLRVGQRTTLARSPPLANRGGATKTKNQ